MAPRRRGDAAEPQAFHELGVRGRYVLRAEASHCAPGADLSSRKTGVFLRDTGERDEHGMQPLEDLLSSPQKAPTPAARAVDDDSGSEDMELESSE